MKTTLRNNVLNKKLRYLLNHVVSYVVNYVVSYVVYHVVLGAVYNVEIFNRIPHNFIQSQFWIQLWEILTCLITQAYVLWLNEWVVSLYVWSDVLVWKSHGPEEVRKNIRLRDRLSNRSYFHFNQEVCGRVHTLPICKFELVLDD